ncbi:NUDIX domain-containing protein [Nonomuraea thailandensis]
MPLMRERVRAILVDHEGCLLTIKRIKPGQQPYWEPARRRVENTDTSLEDALARELREELGAEAAIHALVHILTTTHDRQYFFLTRLLHHNPADRSGLELTEPGRGHYVPERIPLTEAGIGAITLRPRRSQPFSSGLSPPPTVSSHCPTCAFTIQHGNLSRRGSGQADERRQWTSRRCPAGNCPEPGARWCCLVGVAQRSCRPGRAGLRYCRLRSRQNHPIGLAALILLHFTAVMRGLSRSFTFRVARRPRPSASRTPCPLRRAGGTVQPGTSARRCAR